MWEGAGRGPVHTPSQRAKGGGGIEFSQLRPNIYTNIFKYLDGARLTK